VECHSETAAAARQSGTGTFETDIERGRIPVGNGFFDIVVANQVLEHTKEIFWTFSEVSRILRVGESSLSVCRI
jgi:hypothetical protein